MAKKKVTQKSTDTKETNPQEQKSQNQTREKTLTHRSSLEDHSEQLENLRNLNAMLISKSHEQRQQVDSLSQAQKALEAELSRFGVVKSELQAGLSDERDKNVSLEMEKSLLSVFLMTQMKEIGEGLSEENNERENEIRVLKSEVSGLARNITNETEKLNEACRERDLITNDLDCQVKEASKLKDRLVEMEARERNLNGKLLVLKKDRENLKREKNEKDEVVEVLKKEKYLLETRLAGLEKEMSGLSQKLGGSLSEKKEIEMQNSEQKVKILEMEKEVAVHKENILKLQKKEQVLRGKIFDLEKSYGKAMDEKEGMALEIKALIHLEREKQRCLEKLMGEKDDISQRLAKALEELNDNKGRIAKLLREKNDFEERTVSMGSEIAGLHMEISDLKDIVLKLKESCNDQEEKNKRLVHEVDNCKLVLEQANRERNNVRMGLVEERKNCKSLRLKVSELESRIKENVEMLAKNRNEHERLIERRKKMENQIGLLVEEKELMQKNLLEEKLTADDLRDKLESLGFNSDRALSMLKKAAATVCQSENERHGKQELVVNEKRRPDETEQHVALLEAIQNAFKNKEKSIEGMQREVEFMQNSVAEAQKKKSFWTLVSSATTFVAAVSIAYAARIQ